MGSGAHAIKSDVLWSAPRANYKNGRTRKNERVGRLKAPSVPFNFAVPLNGKNARHRKRDYGGARSIPAPKRWR